MQAEINLICIENNGTLTLRVKALNCDLEEINLISGSCTQATGIISQEDNGVSQDCWAHKAGRAHTY